MSAPSDPVQSDTARRTRRLSLVHWILIAMVVGVLVGWRWPAVAASLAPLATIFLRLIKSLVVPLIFTTLVVGVAGHGDDMRRVGRLALRSIVYFELVTTGALAIALMAANLVRPGAGVQLAHATTTTGAELARHPITLSGVLEHAVPQSIAEAAATNDVLQVVVFAILFAVALTRVRAQAKTVVLEGCDSVSQVVFQMVDLVMMYAPIGIGAAIAVTVATSGPAVLVSLGKLILTLYGALVVFVIVVLVPVALVARVPLRAFVRAVREPALIAFSTASSEAALPRAMEAMKALGVPPRIVGFVIPTGYSFNLDGSTLYLGVASLFAVQAAGIHMPLGEQLVLMATLMLTSKGVAGVARGSLVVLAGALATFGLPLEAVAVILGVDAVMDMGRTTINVIGNCLASVVLARWEGEFR